MENTKVFSQGQSLLTREGKLKMFSRVNPNNQAQYSFVPQKDFKPVVSSTLATQTKPSPEPASTELWISFKPIIVTAVVVALLVGGILIFSLGKEGGYTVPKSSQATTNVSKEEESKTYHMAVDDIKIKFDFEPGFVLDELSRSASHKGGAGCTWHGANEEMDLFVYKLLHVLHQL